MWRLITDVKLKDTTVPNYVITDGSTIALVSCNDGELVDDDGFYSTSWATHIMKLPKLPKEI